MEESESMNEIIYEDVLTGKKYIVHCERGYENTASKKIAELIKYEENEQDIKDLREVYKDKLK